MKRNFLVSYYIKGKPEPKNGTVLIDKSITDLELPFVLQNHLSSYETYITVGKSYVSSDITIINFWEIL